MKKKTTTTKKKNNNQRTNGPVTLTWHLVLGMERGMHFFFFTISNMYIAQVMGIQPLSTGSGSIFKFLSLLPHYFIRYFVIFHTCTYSPRQTTLGVNLFDGSRKILPFWSLVACFKKYLCSLNSRTLLQIRTFFLDCALLTIRRVLRALLLLQPQENNILSKN